MHELPDITEHLRDITSELTAEDVTSGAPNRLVCRVNQHVLRSGTEQPADVLAVVIVIR